MASMKEKILNFFKTMNPKIIVQAPSRINLINPLDAVEGDFWMPSVAINGVDNPLSVFCYFRESDKKSILKIFKLTKGNNIKIYLQEEISKDILDYKEKFNSKFKLYYGTIYRFQKTSSLFWKRFLETNFEIGLLTTIPRQSGLGGSAAIIISILYGFSKFFKLGNIKENNDSFPINRDIIAEMATKVEDEDLKITAGFADRYVISRGGLAFCSYYGKLHHKDLEMEPLAVYDRIDKIYCIQELPIIVCFSGVYHESGGVHGTLRKLYLHEEPEIIKSYERLAELSWKSRFALMRQDWKKLGKYFKENTKIMNEVMYNAGFKHGIGLANNILIGLIEDHPDVYAVKLTGAGGGGSVFALVNPKKIEKVLKFWKERLHEIIINEKSFKALFPNLKNDIREELKNAQFFQIKIHEGVQLI